MKAKLVNENLNNNKITTIVVADWDDTEELANSFITALKKFNIFVYEDPSSIGGDMFVYIISNMPLSKKEIKEYSS